MTRTHWLVVGGLLLMFLPWYVAVGIGYERLQGACFDSRHSIDHEGRVGDGLGIILWPMALPFSGGQSCLPVPVGETSPPS